MPQVVPVAGRARDVFLAASALAVVIDGEPEPPRARLSPLAIRAAFAVTDRDADVASLSAKG